MRKIKHLQSIKYISSVGGESRFVSTKSGQITSRLSRVYFSKEEIALKIFAKFNSGLLNGINILGFLSGKSGEFDSIVDSFKIYRVDDSSWSETFVASIVPTKSGMKNIGYCSQSTLGLNELSGAETYAIEAVAMRRNKTYKSKIYVNHLGCFDSIFRIKQELDFLNLSKADK